MTVGTNVTKFSVILGLCGGREGTWDCIQIMITHKCFLSIPFYLGSILLQPFSCNKCRLLCIPNVMEMVRGI